MGSVIYVIPFIFVLDPAFILKSDVLSSTQVVLEALIGVWLICGGLQGFLSGYGRLNHYSVRIALAVGGLLIALPYMGIAWPEAPANADHLMLGAVLVGLGVLANIALFKQTPETSQ
jgi:hypothetical protein